MIYYRFNIDGVVGEWKVWTNDGWWSPPWMWRENLRPNIGLEWKNEG